MSSEYTSGEHQIVVRVTRSSSMAWSAHITSTDGMSSYYIVPLPNANSLATAMDEAMAIAHLRHPPNSP